MSIRDRFIDFCYSTILTGCVNIINSFFYQPTVDQLSTRYQPAINQAFIPVHRALWTIYAPPVQPGTTAWTWLPPFPRPSSWTGAPWNQKKSLHKGHSTVTGLSAALTAITRAAGEGKGSCQSTIDLMSSSVVPFSCINYINSFSADKKEIKNSCDDKKDSSSSSSSSDSSCSSSSVSIQQF